MVEIGVSRLIQYESTHQSLNTVFDNLVHGSEAPCIETDPFLLILHKMNKSVHMQKTPFSFYGDPLIRFFFFLRQFLKASRISRPTLIAMLPT